MADLPPFRVLSPTAILGYGFPSASFEAGLAMKPDVIAVDAGSTDPGPFYLGAGLSFTDRSAVKRDLRHILTAGRARDIPVLIGSAGGAGARPHLDWCTQIIREIAAEEKLTGALAVIGADMDKALLSQALAAGQITALPPGPEAQADLIDSSSHIVAQMGEAPLIAALDAGARVIVAGRCYDPSVFAAEPIRRGYPPGLALHMGKILECAAIAAQPGSGSDCMIGTLDAEGFTVEPTAPERACTVASVAAHTLYEKSDPFHLPGPGGALDLTATQFEQRGARKVRVTGTTFIPAQEHIVKLEGARRTGFRTVSIAGARSPDFIAGLDDILQGVRDRVADNFADMQDGAAQLLFKVYGRDAVMGALEPLRHQPAHEVGIVIEAVAPSQDQADTICGFARATLLHFGYPGRVSTAGNLAFPYSPSDFKAGAVYEFSLYHLLHGADPATLFPLEMSRLEAPA
ncbi:acyclic terpene utilization AtuA family protein [Aliishimia ponticola]|uniref:Acyclic terpene utilization AtuA family protein n=1 Tax=Aliishimia ponticola TaxID=2499833 RepID=A0A4S4NB20_9RHOB|nr:acyclic terpene utilization AtuA family protein [Aliishimia ponticola]THH35875.1 acyclic terpene utilization AtuA family protein [Aliishimia ponticola]